MILEKASALNSYRLAAQNALGIDEITIGIIAFALGFFMTFFGRKFLKVLIFTMSALFGGIVCWMSLPSLLHDLIGISIRATDTVRYCVSALAALLCGLLGHFFWKVAVFASGGVGGLLLGSWTIALAPSGMVEEFINRRGYLIIFSIIGGIVAMLLEAYVVIGTSILAGALAMVYGLDTFLQLGYTRYMRDMIDYHKLSVDRLTPTGWGLLAAGIGFAFLGLIVQCHQYQKRK